MADQWFRDPKQRRSRETLDRILDATRSLVADGAPVRVSEIARRARCSVGSFYARFPDRDTLFHVLQAEMVARVGAETDERLHPDRSRGVPLREVLRGFLAFAAEEATQNRELRRHLKDLSLAAGGGRFRERAESLERRTADAIERLLDARLPAHTGSVTGTRARAAFLELMVRGTLTAASTSKTSQPRELVEELTELCARYLES